MKIILIVDDTKLARHLLAKKFQPFSDEFEIVTAANGKEALECINNVPVDLVVTDIEMPVMDGFELIAHMNNRHPQIPVFVMTAKGSPEIEEKIDAMGSFRYFEKPLKFDALLAAVRETLESAVRGEVNGISMSSFLQLVNMEQKSCTLRIRHRGRVGHLYCLQGELIAAETDGLSAEEAAIEMLSWDAASIEILEPDQQKQKEIKQPLMNILMEGARRKDEIKAAAKKDVAPDRPVKPAKPDKSPKTAGNGTKGDTDISSLYEWE